MCSLASPIRGYIERRAAGPGEVEGWGSMMYSQLEVAMNHSIMKLLSLLKTYVLMIIRSLNPRLRDSTAVLKNDEAGSLASRRSVRS